MKTRLLTCLILLTGFARADLVGWGDLTNQAEALINRTEKPRLAEVNALATVIKAATPDPVSSAVTPTEEQAAYRKLVDTTARLLYRRISAQTGIDYAISRQYWWQAGLLKFRAGKYADAVALAAQWKDAEPGDITRQAFWLKAKAATGQDVKTEVEAIAASDTPLDDMVASDLLDAWCLSAGHPYPSADLQTLIDLLAQSQSNSAFQPAVRLMGATKKASDGINVNHELTAILTSITGLVRVSLSREALAAFNHAAATNAEVIAFYDQLLRVTDANPASVGFLRNIIDQKLKLQ